MNNQRERGGGGETGKRIRDVRRFDASLPKPMLRAAVADQGAAVSTMMSAPQERELPSAQWTLRLALVVVPQRRNVILTLRCVSSSSWGVIILLLVSAGQVILIFGT